MAPELVSQAASLSKNEIDPEEKEAEVAYTVNIFVIILNIDYIVSIRCYLSMTVNQLANQKPFTTADGSTIRSILDATNAPVEKQSLAEASLPKGGQTERHYHKLSEEIYFILEGEAMMEIDGDTQVVTSNDAILIPAGAWHQITATTGIRFLCCCAPVYSHEDTYFE